MIFRAISNLSLIALQLKAERGEYVQCVAIPRTGGYYVTSIYDLACSACKTFTGKMTMTSVPVSRELAEGLHPALFEHLRNPFAAPTGKPTRELSSPALEHAAAEMQEQIHDIMFAG